MKQMDSSVDSRSSSAEESYQSSSEAIRSPSLFEPIIQGNAKNRNFSQRIFKNNSEKGSGLSYR